MDLHGFNPNDAPEWTGGGGYRTVPPGRYLALIKTEQEKPNKKGTGSYLELVFEILDGPHKGMQVWRRLNLVNPSETARSIAWGELGAICIACGKQGLVNDTRELLNTPVWIDVTEVPRGDDPSRLTNEIENYEQHAGGGGGGAVRTPPQQQPKAPSHTGPPKPDYTAGYMPPDSKGAPF